MEYKRKVEVEIPKLDAKGLIIETDGKAMIDKHIVTVRRLNYGEKVDLEDESTDVKVVGNNPIAKVSMGKLRICSLLKSCSSETLPLKNTEDIRKLPPEVGDMLFNIYIEVNSTDPKSVG